MEICKYLQHHVPCHESFGIYFSSSSPHHKAIILYILKIWIERIYIAIDLDLRWVFRWGCYFYEERDKLFSSQYTIWISIVSIEYSFSVCDECISLETISDSDIQKVACSIYRFYIIIFHDIDQCFSIVHRSSLGETFFSFSKHTFFIHKRIERSSYSTFSLASL